MPPVIDNEKCSGCGTCVDRCPMDVFVFNNDDVPKVKYSDECWHCNSCVLDCPMGAISLRIPLPAMMLYVDAVKSD